METKTQLVNQNQQNGGLKKEISQSQRFALAVEKEFPSIAGPVALTGFQRKLCQNYFIRVDAVLRDAEKKRLAKSDKYRDQVSLTWENINLKKLAVDVITFSSVGLDPVQPNHISPIPFKNNSTGKYDIVFIVGYKGTELKAKKYGVDVPDDIIVELVYEKDKFKQIKRDMNNKIETYVFEVVEDFDRGEIVGGFYYYRYFSTPEKNKLRIFSKKDIEKRKPDYVSPEFWGGEKDKWVDGKKEGKETVEGWFDEMAYKTIYKAAYNAITIDSAKIDENYLAVIEKEDEFRDYRINNEIANNANKTEIGFTEEVAQLHEIENKTHHVNENAAEVISKEAEKNVDKSTGEVKEPVQMKAPF